MQQPNRQHYLDYWGFSKAPFALTPDPEMLYLSKQHRECMLRLQYAIASNKGGALLVSENPGDGKTSILKRLQVDLVNSVDERYRVVFIDHPTLTPNQVLWEILRQLGLGDTKGEKIQNLLHLRETLEEMHDRGERVVFILDEGQLLADRPELLQEFRVLLNYTVGEIFLLTFIFSGQSELETTMKRLPELYQRLPVRYFLHSMDRVDTGRMLEHRIKVAGYRNGPLFSEAAVAEIYKYSQGIPRVICTVADLALVVGHSRNVRRITDNEVLMAIRDLDRNTQDGYHYYHFLRSAGAVTPDEEAEIQQAEADLDRAAAEDAMHRLESQEAGEVPDRPSTDPAPIEFDEAEEEAAPEPAADTPMDPVQKAEDRWAWEGGTLPPLEEAEETADETASEASPEEPDDGTYEVEVLDEGTVPDEEAAAAPPDPWTNLDSYLEAKAELVHCPVCGTRQPSERSTCTQCAAPLHWVCPSCDHKNGAYRARCERCGQSLAQAVAGAETALRETVAESVAGPDWGFVGTPDFSLKLGEGERILAVVKNKSLLSKGVKVRARVQGWGSREKKADLVVTNHRLHVVARDLQSRIPYHEIKGLRASKGKLNLFHTDGSLRMDYPVSDSALYELINALIDFLEFQSGRFRV